MKAIVTALALITTLANAAPTTPTTPPKPVEFDFRMINVAQVIQLVYGEALKSPFVIDPDVLKDERQVSFRYRANNGEIKQFTTLFLDSLGFTTTSKNGIDFISKKSNSAPTEDQDIFVYRPKYRDVSELTKLLSPLFKGLFTVNRGITNSGPKTDKPVPEGSAAALTDQKLDTLIFQSTPKEVANLKKLLAQVDDKQGEVMVRAAVYEVTTDKGDGSAFNLALNVLGSKLSLSLGSTTPLESFVHFKNASIDSVFSALSNDSRFNAVSTPSLRVQSGKTGRFTVGQDVPVLSSVSYPSNGGTPVQSVEYKSSGVIFEISPTVRTDTIDLNVDQQLSNFVNTTTGVNSSPTLIKRQVRSTLSTPDGEVIILGGLAETKDTTAHKGFSFLPAFMSSNTTSTSKTEILLILQVKTL